MVKLRAGVRVSLRVSLALGLLLGLALGCGHLPPRPVRTSRITLPIQALPVASNGLRVILVPDPKATQVEVAVRYEVGDTDEPAGQEGVAHLAEHLMFLQRIGAQGETLSERLDATATWFNAYTRLESTTFVARAAPERLAELLRLEGLRLTLGCKTLTEEAFLRERDVVRNEIRERAGDQQLVEGVYGALYSAAHPYTLKLPVDEGAVARLTRAQACSFIDAHYSPDNAVLVISGQLDAAVVSTALRQQLGRIARRPLAPRTAIAPIRAPSRSQLDVPGIGEAAIVMWPLSADPDEAARMRVVAELMRLQIDPKLAGSLSVLELGEGRAPAIGFLIRPGADQSPEGAIEEVKDAALAMQVLIDPDAYGRARVRAGHDLFQRFEDSDERVAILAGHAAAGRDPVQGLSAELGALDQLTISVARQVLVEHFAFDRAAVLTILPAARRSALAAHETGTSAQPPALEPALHRPGESRGRIDPAAARVAVPLALGRDPFARVQQRTLPNGMRVILMPLASLPTVDIRLVFGGGTADEPERARGAAVFAAHGLLPSGRDFEELHDFYVVGGAYSIDVGLEHTSFEVSGLDMHVDHLLWGLELLVRNGWYADVDRQKIMRRVVSASRADPLADRWRAALFGPDHPYVHAEDWRGASFDKLDGAAVKRFRAAYLQPRTATLIVAGGFDPVIADRWIDYLFADWGGRAAPASLTAPATVHPVALARADESARQVSMRIAFRGVGGRAELAIAAEMIEAALADVRAQLGASYGVHARLVESRLGARIEVWGEVAVERAIAALGLVRARLARLGAADDVAAGLFVTARRAAMARLAAPPTGAFGLAGRAEAAVKLGLPIDADRGTAAEAGKLTLDRMGPALAPIELSRAAVLLVGPRDAVTRGYAALGLTPSVVEK